MESPVSTHDKKSFIYWFLDTYRLKQRESTWILKYLIHHTDILERVHFVQNARLCPRGITISTSCSEEVPFCFYKDHLVTTDVDKTFHDIRLNKEQPVYIQLNFENCYQNAFYTAVLEENPFEPEQRSDVDEKYTEELLNKILLDYKINKYNKNINSALDSSNKADFYYWSNLLNKLLIEHQVKST